MGYNADIGRRVVFQDKQKLFGKTVILLVRMKLKSVANGDTFEGALVMDVSDKSFNQVIEIIENARDNAFRKVNEELILMYQAVGKFLSENAKESSYGEGYIDSLASYIQEQFPGRRNFQVLKGFQHETCGI